MALFPWRSEVDDFREIGKSNSNWNRWGAEDRIGTLNLITPDCVVSAMALVKRGAIFDLGLPLGRDGVQIGVGGRVNPVHLMSASPLDTENFNAGLIGPKGMINVDDFIMMPLQCTTQWDGLGHVGYDDSFYNNVPVSSVTTNGGSTQLSIHQIAAKGVVGRGVLLDVAALLGVDKIDAGVSITPSHLEAAEARQGVLVGAGDILLLRTGWIRNFTIDGSARDYWNGEPGVDLSCIEWLRRRGVAALASDNWGIEVAPPNSIRFNMPVHCVLIRDLGMTLGEIFDLDALAADCEKDGRWDFLFVAPPLKVLNGVGSPITPLAMK
jgi:kynurenine formamidase